MSLVYNNKYLQNKNFIILKVSMLCMFGWLVGWSVYNDDKQTNNNNNNKKV